MMIIKVSKARSKQMMQIALPMLEKTAWLLLVLSSLEVGQWNCDDIASKSLSSHLSYWKPSSVLLVSANPASRPYIAYRTKLFGPETYANNTKNATDNSDFRRWNPPLIDPSTAAGAYKKFASHLHAYTDADPLQCPLQFSLGISKRLHAASTHTEATTQTATSSYAIRQPVCLQTVFPATAAAGKQVIYSTQYEHLNILSPVPLQTVGQTVKEVLVEQGPEFPLLLESAVLSHTHPVLHDVNGDGVLDAILADYDGGITVVGLGWSPVNDDKIQDSNNNNRHHRKASRIPQRHLHHVQVPRLYVRRDWIQHRVKELTGVEKDQNETVGTIFDPFHSYFEYAGTGMASPAAAPVLRGVSANLLHQEGSVAEALRQRRATAREQRRKEAGMSSEPADLEALETEYEHGEDQYDKIMDERMEEAQQEQQLHRKLQEVPRMDPNERPAEELVVEQHQDAYHGAVAQDLGGALEQQHAQVARQDQNHNLVAPHDGVPEQIVQERQGMAQQHDHPVSPNEAPAEQLNTIPQHQESITDEHKMSEQQGNSPEIQRQESQEEHKEVPNEIVAKNGLAQELRGDAPKQHEGTAHEGSSHGGEAQDVVLHKGEAIQQGKQEQQNQEPADLEQLQQKQQEQVVLEGEFERELEKLMDGEDVNGKGEDPLDDDRVRDFNEEAYADDLMRPPDAKVDDVANVNFDDAPVPPGESVDDYAADSNKDDVDYARYHDDFGGDDMYDYGRHHEEYYDEVNYIRLPPHILSTPIHAELPKLYGNTEETEDVLFVAVSYFLDEDEAVTGGSSPYQRWREQDPGGETEVRRGMYVANSLMSYVMGESTRWSGQVHLDLSTDFTAPENITLVGDLPVHEDQSRMGAFALASPTFADLEGDEKPEVLVGTSMGLVYAYDARQLFRRDKWPVQMRHPIETRILVEDVLGDTNLEVFVLDTGGDIACLNHNAEVVWFRNVMETLISKLPSTSAQITASSPMTMGDVDGDGKIDIVFLVQIDNQRTFIFVLDAASGADVSRFPLELERESENDQPAADLPLLHQKLPQPLLVDLHMDYLSRLLDYIRRSQSESNWTKAKHGAGLHIVQPLGEQLYIVEGSSGCTQLVSIGDNVLSTIQVDDVHGTNKLDLVIGTESGNVITLESTAPFHPLNTWTHGELRSRTNGMTHGYSASQGVFVHERSRQFIDVFGVYVPIEFEIFDNRPNIANEPDKRKYKVEIRDGTSSKRVLFRHVFNSPGVYAERLYIRYGPGYYNLNIVMETSHGLIYEDSFNVGYNVHFMDGFGILLIVPLMLAGAAIVLCGSKKQDWESDDYDADRDGHSLGILGATLPS